MALIDTTGGTTAPAPGAAATARARPSQLRAAPNPWLASELRRRGTPFLLAIMIAVALLPLDVGGPADWMGVLPGIVLLGVIIAVAIALSRTEHPGLLGQSVPYVYLLAITLLRDGTGGAASGYGILYALAPFWVALYGTRRHVYGTTSAMFVLLVGLPPVDGETLRRAVLSTMAGGLVAVAVHGKVAALRDAQARVHQEAEARARAFEQLAANADALERSNHELEQFAYVSSHDIQEPLRMIRSFSQLFMQRYGHQVDDQGRELLGFVVDGAERAQQLVNDLLQYSLIGRSERAFVPIELDDCLDRALETLAPQVDGTGATIERPSRLPMVHGDASQLESLFVNLVGNALKYRHADRAPTIEVGGRVLDGDRAELTVRDDGIGFQPEHAAKIFRMFQRLHGRTRYEGTGIGLAICARVVELHGGSIEAEGRPGAGASFRVVLPTATSDGDTR